ncbi:unnamed protein product, partial [Musa acuminata subsp. burmannicoides]
SSSSSSPSRLGFRFAFSWFVLIYVVVLDRAFLPSPGVVPSFPWNQTSFYCRVRAADRTVMDGFKLDAPRQYFATSSLVVGYALCSSLLSVINKFAITMFDYPGLLTALQYLTSAVGVWVLGKLGFLYHDPFVFETAKKFLPAATVFYLAIFTNTNLLRHANVDTFIVFRSLTPLLVAIADTIFRKQPCPSRLTFLSLVVILGGAVCYVLTDSAFNLTAYSWAIAYLVTITTEMVYIKHMVTNLGLNTWGFVFYNNLLSLMMAPVFWFVTGEYADVFTAYGSSSGIWFNIMAFVAVALSCVFGFLISFFGFAARKAISATAFTVTGVANKFLTVAINVLIWDKHASKIGLICLLLTLVGGVLYQQSVTSNGNLSQQHGSTISKKANGVVRNVDSEDERHDKRLSGRDSNLRKYQIKLPTQVAVKDKKPRRVWHQPTAIPLSSQVAQEYMSCTPQFAMSSTQGTSTSFPGVSPYFQFRWLLGRVGTSQKKCRLRHHFPVQASTSSSPIFPFDRTFTISRCLFASLCLDWSSSLSRKYGEGYRHRGPSSTPF